MNEILHKTNMLSPNCKVFTNDLGRADSQSITEMTLLVASTLLTGVPQMSDVPLPYVSEMN